MSMSKRRVRAIFRKELREYRRNRSLVYGMGIVPLLFCVQPLVQVFALPASASGSLTHEHVLLYLLGIPAIVPAFVAAYSWSASVSRARSSPCSRLRFAARSCCWARPWPPSSPRLRSPTSSIACSSRASNSSLMPGWRRP